MGLNQRFPRLMAVSHRGGDDLFGGGHSGEHLSDAILPKGPHPEFTGSVPQLEGCGVVVDHLANFIVRDKDLENSKAPAKSLAAAFFTAYWPHRGGLGKLHSIQIQGTGCVFRQFAGLLAVGTESAHQALGHHPPDGAGDSRKASWSFPNP